MLYLYAVSVCCMCSGRENKNEITVRAHLAPGKYMLDVLHREDSLLATDSTEPVSCSRFAWDIDITYRAPDSVRIASVDSGSCDGDLLPVSLMGNGFIDTVTGRMRFLDRIRFDGESLSQETSFSVKALSLLRLVASHPQLRLAIELTSDDEDGGSAKGFAAIHHSSPQFRAPPPHPSHDFSHPMLSHEYLTHSPHYDPLHAANGGGGATGGGVHKHAHAHPRRFGIRHPWGILGKLFPAWNRRHKAILEAAAHKQKAAPAVIPHPPLPKNAHAGHGAHSSHDDTSFLQIDDVATTDEEEEHEHETEAAAAAAELHDTAVAEHSAPTAAKSDSTSPRVSVSSHRKRLTGDDEGLWAELPPGNYKLRITLETTVLPTDVRSAHLT